MAVYAYMANLTLNTSAKRDAIYSKIETYLSGKPVWGNSVLTKGTDEETGNPSIGIEVRFNQKPHLDSLFDLAKTELNKLTGVKATFSRHICYHDDRNQPCAFEEVASIER